METAPRTPASRPNLVSVGTIIWLSSELMFFAALFAMYFTVRSVVKGSGMPWPGAHLNLALGSINTTVLLLSSVTCQMGVFAVERGQIRRTGSVFNPARQLADHARPCRYQMRLPAPQAGAVASDLYVLRRPRRAAAGVGDANGG